MSFSGEKTGPKMNKQLLVVIDADAIIAQTNPDDALHKRAQEIALKLIALNARILYPTSTLAEASAHIQRVLKDSVSAYKVAMVANNPTFEIAGINQDTLSHALTYFSSTTSKKNTLFDCIVAAVAEENNADAIFSFDKFYKSKGFKLASELEK